MIKRFIIYGLLGWNIEIFWTGINSLIKGNLQLEGFTNLWMFFIYGSAVIVLEPLHHIIRDWKWPVRGFLWMVIIWGIEYSSGLFFKSAIGISPWYYSGPFAVDNLVRIDYGPAWFIAGLLFERVHNALDAYRIS